MTPYQAPPGCSEAETIGHLMQWLADRLLHEAIHARDIEEDPARWQQLTMLAASAEQSSIEAGKYLNLFKRMAG